MSIFKFKGKVIGSTVSGTVIKAISASRVSILAIFLPFWIIALIANLLVEEGSFLFVLFAPFLLVLAFFYGIFWLIWMLIGALIG